MEAIEQNRINELKLLPIGHVLRRPTEKIKERVIIPRYLNQCDICWVKHEDQKMIISERGGTGRSLLECLSCYVIREHELW